MEAVVVQSILFILSINFCFTLFGHKCTNLILIKILIYLNKQLRNLVSFLLLDEVGIKKMYNLVVDMVLSGRLN